MQLHPSSPGTCYGAAVLGGCQYGMLCTSVDLSMGVRMAKFGFGVSVPLEAEAAEWCGI